MATRSCNPFLVNLYRPCNDFCSRELSLVRHAHSSVVPLDHVGIGDVPVSSDLATRGDARRATSNLDLVHHSVLLNGLLNDLGGILVSNVDTSLRAVLLGGADDKGAGANDRESDPAVLVQVSLGDGPVASVRGSPIFDGEAVGDEGHVGVDVARVKAIDVVAEVLVASHLVGNPGGGSRVDSSLHAVEGALIRLGRIESKDGENAAIGGCEGVADSVGKGSLSCLADGGHIGLDRLLSRSSRGDDRAQDGGEGGDDGDALHRRGDCE